MNMANGPTRSYIDQSSEKTHVWRSKTEKKPTSVLYFGLKLFLKKGCKRTLNKRSIIKINPNHLIFYFQVAISKPFHPFQSHFVSVRFRKPLLQQKYVKYHEIIIKNSRSPYLSFQRSHFKAI